MVMQQLSTVSNFSGRKGDPPMNVVKNLQGYAVPYNLLTFLKITEIYIGG
jgi:hypothetical protein